MNLSKKNIPVHSLPEKEAPVIIRRIEHKNPYDFTTEHRHTYFEIFFFENGGGKQLIDFNESKVNPDSCYIVFPQQIHLLRREDTANGLLVQFSETVIPSTQIHNLLKQHYYSDSPEMFFEGNPEKIVSANRILTLMKESNETGTTNSYSATVHYLQALLLMLLDSKKSNPSEQIDEDRKLLFEFQQELDKQFRINHTVGKYAALLNCTDKKLAGVTKKYLGLSPLQVIHNRVLLEAKRMLIFETNSHKEIAFHLGFDSPSSFSLFIKNKTGSSPSELIEQLAEIHK